MVSVCLPSDALLQHLPSYLGFSYLGGGVSLHGCFSKAQPLLLTLDEGHLLTATLPDLQRGIAPLGPPVPGQPPLLGCGVASPGCRPWPRAWGCSSRLPPGPIQARGATWRPVTSVVPRVLALSPGASAVPSVMALTLTTSGWRHSPGSTWESVPGQSWTREELKPAETCLREPTSPGLCRGLWVAGPWSLQRSLAPSSFTASAILTPHSFLSSRTLFIRLEPGTALFSRDRPPPPPSPHKGRPRGKDGFCRDVFLVFLSSTPVSWSCHRQG